MPENATTLPEPASLGRRLAAMFYESFLLIAVLMLAGFAYLPIFGTIQGPFQKAVFQLYLLGVMLLYFVVFWRRGQTLAMKTWRIQLVSTNGEPPSTAQCLARFSLAMLGLMFAGVGFGWALFDPERQFLHDRLCRTRLVRADRPDRQRRSRRISTASATPRNSKEGAAAVKNGGQSFSSPT